MAASANQQLLEIAEDVVRSLETRRSSLEAELLQIETRKRELEAQINATQFARQRLSNLRFKVGPDYQCPRCWITNETRSGLRPVPSDTKDDLFACDTCGLDVRIKMGF